MEMNKNNYKLVIFDVDGTLLDTSEGLLKSTIYTIEKLGYPMPTKEILFSFIGPRIQDSLAKVFGLEGEELNRAATLFRNHYKEGAVMLAKPYEGMYDVLQELKRKEIRMAIATNKRQDFIEALADKYGVSDYINVIWGTDFQGKLKKEDLIRNCIKEFPECSAEDVVMIGDSAYDAEAAKNVGVDFIGVTYGFDFKKEEDIEKWDNIGKSNDMIGILKILIGT